ncbi:DUF4942 domain-containing protein, partial [Pseudomonas aeruginosa]
DRPGPAGSDRLADLERMLYLFSGKPIPDNRENITIHLDDHIHSVLDVN